ncbi:MAG: MFS transporter [Sphingobium sp.]
MPNDVMHPLRYPNYRIFLISRFCAVLGQSGMMIILGWQAYNLARLEMGTRAAAAQLGLIGLAQFLPLFFLTPVSGWVADRFDRRTTSCVSLVMQIICAAILCYATYHGSVSLPLIFAIAGLLGVARCFNGPALSAIAPNLIPRAVLPRAVAFSSMAWQTGIIVGPAVGGYAYAVEPWGAYAVSVALFCVSLAGIFSLKDVPQAPADRNRHPLRQMVDGLTYVRSNRLVLASITLDLFAVLLGGATALLPIFARDIYHVDSTGLGQLAAAPGVGAMLTAFWFSIRPIRTNVGNKMLGAVIVFGLTTIVLGLTAFIPHGLAMPVALLALVTLGVSDMISVFVRQSLIQLHTPDAMRGRVGSVSQLTISASNELGEAESGFAAALIGPVAAVIAGGAGAIIITLLWAKIFPELGLARSFDPPDMDDATREDSKPQQEARA